jgi:phosphate transport system permease protein
MSADSILRPPENLRRRRVKAAVFRGVTMALTWFCLVLLAVLLVHATRQGLPWLDSQFLSDFPSRFPERAGIKSALYGTLWLISLTACFSIPVGVAAAIYLEEYASRTRLNTLIDVAIANLAGVPSIVYGILGLAIFVRWMSLGRSVVAGALTMTLLILPIIIIASREALRAVPDSIRRAAFALGATRWQTVRHHVMPQALPGILTGTILALSRAIGETAPLIMIGALTYVAFVPDGPMDAFTALPIQIFNWVSRPQAEFHELAAAGIIVLLTVLLLMNATAVFIRHRSQRKILK